MRIGFTGTRYGMTSYQYQMVEDILNARNSVELHHGDCVGSDEAAHYLAIGSGGVAIIHPPVKEEHRAFCVGGLLVMPALSHFARNRNIVDVTECLIATPFNDFEEDRGGTWYTINYAKKMNKPIIIVWPTVGMSYHNLENWK